MKPKIQKINFRTNDMGDAEMYCPECQEWCIVDSGGETLDDLTAGCYIECGGCNTSYLLKECESQWWDQYEWEMLS